MASKALIEIEIKADKSKVVIEGLESDIKDLQTTYKNLSDAIKKNESVLSGTEKAYKTAQAELQKIRSNIKAGTKEYNDYTQKIHDLQIALDSLNKKEREQSKVLDKHKKDLDRQAVAQNKRELMLAKRAATLEKNTQKLKARNKALMAERDAVKASAAQNRKNSALITQRNKELKKSTAELKRFEKAVKAQQRTLERQRTALAKSQEALKKKTIALNEAKIALKEKEAASKKEAAAVAGTEGFYRKKIAALEKERATTADTTMKYRELTVEIGKQYEAIRNLTQGEEVRHQHKQGTFAAIEAEITYYKRLQKQYATTSQEVLEYDKRILKLQADQKRLATGTTMAAKGMQQQSASAGVASAAALELGRGVSDLNYGIRGVANNMQQFGALMLSLVQQEKGLSGAFKSLGKTLMGPTGILIAFQAGIMLLEGFAMRQEKAKKNAKGLNDSLIDQSALLMGLQNTIDLTNMSYDEQLNALKTLAVANSDLKSVMTDTDLTEAQRVEKGMALVELQREQREIGVEFNKYLEETNDQYEGLIISQERIDQLEKSIATNKENAKLIQGQAGTLAQMEISRLEKQRDLIKEAVEEMNNFSVEGRTVFDIQQDISNFLEKSKDETKKVVDVTKKWAESLKEAKAELLDTKIAEAESLADKALSEDNIKEYRKYTDEALRLKRLQLSKQKQDEINNAKETAKELGQDASSVINIIENRYSILFRQLGRDMAQEVKEGVEEIIDKEKVDVKPSSTKLAGAQGGVAFTEASGVKNIGGLDPLAQLTVPSASDIVSGIAEYREEDPVEGPSRLEEFSLGLQQFQELSNTFIDFLASEAERELDIERRKNNEKNELLRERLRNENLSASQRKKINLEIAKNDAELVKKENEINKRRFQQEKAAGISNAIINTFLGASQALADNTISPKWLSPAVAATIIASGLAQVAMISRQQFVPKKTNTRGLGRGGSVGGGGGFSPQFNVVGSSGQNQLATAISSKFDQPVKAYVTVNEINSAQSFQRNIEESASI